ncbi:MAG: alanine--tRNA ligase [Thermoanaerobacteraceae bacterium]|nr:alanine--tRNA ligase [Thermoanaerobacteraceae bacterium]
MMTSNEIREKFLSYFESKGHTRVISSSLVPQNDPTLLFTNAGMNQFKDVFLGLTSLPYSRAVSCQKCVRAGGKHNDLESVGKTARHHTFFEMLGNFSFGDYFKKEAIHYAWEFLTEVLKLPKEKLWVSIYEEDEEAFELWQTHIPADRIVRLGEKDNFWSMGDTGPCGPCSEIYIDRGENHRCGAKECALGKCDCDRWRELWNLVFMQYNRDEQGNMTLLPKPSIDTGMGLERIATVMQEVYSNYDTDLLRPLISFVEDLSGTTYHEGEEGLPFRVIADHSRAVTFLISDGVLPGNEGRNYVLRRIIRRAARYGKELDLKDPFLYKVIPQVVSLMKDTYPELQKNLEYIQKVVKAEEERFLETLNDGLKILYEGIEKLSEAKKNQIPGDMAFMLYDTYGFPIDLTKDIAEEKGMTVDIKAFEQLMNQQRMQAKAARKETYKIDELYDVLADISPTNFVGYDSYESNSKVLLILRGREIVKTCNDKTADIILVLDKTPFYAESGGQVGDVGVIENEDFLFKVTETHKTPDEKFYHVGRIINGNICVDGSVLAKIDVDKRQSISRNHSATHLLHKALKEVLGEHVNQAGSLVNENRLRFDFSHFAALTSEEIRQVEERVNSAILKNLPVNISWTTFQEAKEQGAIALFGEKYHERVRTVSIGDYSKELCGGTHVYYSSEIGLFKIISESSVGAGIRRIEAVCGLNLMHYLYDTINSLNEVAGLLKVAPHEINQKVNELLEKYRLQEKEIDSLKQRAINYEVDEISKAKSTINGINVISTKVEAKTIDDLRIMSDTLRQKISSGIIVLGSVCSDKIMFVAAVTDDLTKKGYHAGKIVKSVAQIAGGSGGGKPNFAQAGGKIPAKLDEALASVSEIITQIK